MYELEKALRDHELLVLRVIGEWWELDFTGVQKTDCVKTLAQTISQLNMKTELNYLQPEETAAVQELVQAGGRMHVAAFERLHGEVRMMGPGRLEREEPWLDPATPAEGLWYRGFLYRAFEESDSSNLVEYYYLPNELAAQLPQVDDSLKAELEMPKTNLNPTTSPDKSNLLVTDAVDDVTAILASAQLSPLHEEDLDQLTPLLRNNDTDRASLLFTLARELGLLRPADGGFRPSRAAVAWLQQSREKQLRDLADTWSGSAWNDLCHTPGLKCEGSGWKNDPILARTALLDVLPKTIKWYELADLVDLIKEADPDFQRPEGNYNTWYIRDEAGGEYLAGFSNWDAIEGRLLRFLIFGPLHWLGMAEVASNAAGGDWLFCLTPRAVGWLENRPPSAEEVLVPIVVQDDASLLVPFNANLYHRFQVARISEPEALQPDQPYRYRLTPKSLAKAKEQGIESPRLLKFLADASGRPVPPSTRRAIERWAKRGTEGRLEESIILRVRDPEILDKLRANPKTRPYIAESLGDLAVVINRENWEDLRQVVAQLGLLLDHK